MLLLVLSCKQTSNSKDTANPCQTTHDTLSVQEKRQDKDTINNKLGDRMNNNLTYRFIQVFNEHISYSNFETNNSIKYIPKWDKWVVPKESTENYSSYKEYSSNTRVEVTVDTTDKFLIIYHLGTGGGTGKYEFTELSSEKKGEIYLSIYKKLSPEWEEYYPILYFLDKNNNLKETKQISVPPGDSLYSYFFDNLKNMDLIVEDQFIYLKYNYNHNDNHLIVKMGVSYLYDCKRDHFPSNLSETKKKRICEILGRRNKTKALEFKWEPDRNKFVLIKPFKNSVP